MSLIFPELKIHTRWDLTFCELNVVYIRADVMREECYNASVKCYSVVRVCSRRRRDPAAGQAVPQAGPGQLGRALHRRVHVSAGAAAEPARAARHRHIRRRRQRRGGLQGVHPGRVAVQREGRQAVQAAVRLPHLRHGQRRVHIQWRTVPGAEDDGGQQPEGHAAAADRGQDHPVRGQGRGRQDLLRGVLQRGGQHRHPQEDGGGRVGAARPLPPRPS